MLHDVPLADTRFDWEHGDWYDVAAGKGVMLLAALRQELGAAVFDPLMDEFGQAHAGHEVSTAEFREAAEKACGRSLDVFFAPWLAGGNSTALAGGAAGGGFWSIDSFEEEPEKALIVYGTLGDRSAQREAAELLAKKIARRWSNVLITAKSDQEVDEADLKNHHLLLVGRPANNAITARLAEALPVSFGAGSFVVRGETYADARSAVIAAGPNPLNPRYSIVAYAGLGADATCRAVQSIPDDAAYTAQVMLFPARLRPRRLCVTPPAAGIARTP